MAPSAISNIVDAGLPASGDILKSHPSHNTVHTKPITETSFHPYGGLIASNLTIPTLVTPPNAQKSLEVVPTTNTYSSAPSGRPGRHVIHVERVDPKVTKGRSIVLERMERHPFTSQSFVPMGSDVEYLAIVADAHEEEDRPDLNTVKVFSVGDGQGVCYEAGQWHASMHVVGKTPITFVVIQSMNGVPEEDCEFYHIPKEELVNMAF